MSGPAAGEGGVGDSIVPLEAAHLPGEGVERVTLEDATHSIGSPDSWYGSDAVVDDWLPQARRALARQGGAGGAGLSYAAIKKLGVAGTLAYIHQAYIFSLSYGLAMAAIGGAVLLCSDLHYRRPPGALTGCCGFWK